MAGSLSRCFSHMYYSKRTSAITAVFAQGLNLRVNLAKGFLAAALLGSALSAGAFSRNDTYERSPVVETSAVVALSALPTQGRDVYQRILSGGPFRYEKDGSVFGNRERILPRQERGYYREYTVPTPGSRNRGARRIVCGGKFMKSPETCFYTKDHYQSFQKIDPQR
jgi:ribonuclease T1